MSAGLYSIAPGQAVINIGGRIVPIKIWQVSARESGQIDLVGGAILPGCLDLHYVDPAYRKEREQAAWDASLAIPED